MRGEGKTYLSNARLKTFFCGCHPLVSGSNFFTRSFWASNLILLSLQYIGETGPSHLNIWPHITIIILVTIDQPLDEVAPRQSSLKLPLKLHLPSEIKLLPHTSFPQQVKQARMVARLKSGPRGFHTYSHIFSWTGFHKHVYGHVQTVTTCCSLAARLRGNKERMRKCRGNGGRMRECRERRNGDREMKWRGETERHFLRLQFIYFSQFFFLDALASLRTISATDWLTDRKISDC